MIAKILRSGRSFKGAMNYNVEKVFGGVAALVDAVNLPDRKLVTAWNRFREMEENPAVSARTRAFGFHLTLDPGPEDSIDEKGVISLAADVMRHLGYGGQPYLLYRHNDIEREHYHVVSIRVRDDGSAIASYNEGRELVRFMRLKEKEYGYTMPVRGRKEHTPVEPLETVPARFNPQGADVRRQLVTLFNEALSWNFTDFAQFHAVLESWGVYARRAVRRSGGFNIAVSGIGMDGVVNSRTFSLDRDFGLKGMTLFDEAVKRNTAMRGTVLGSKLKCRAVCEYLLDNSCSMDQFVCMCGSLGIAAVPVYTKRAKRLATVILCDTRSKAVFHAEELSPACSVSEFRRRMESGVWHVADKEEMERNRTVDMVTSFDLDEIRRRLMTIRAQYAQESRTPAESVSLHRGMGI